MKVLTVLADFQLIAQKRRKKLKMSENEESNVK